MVAFFFFYLIKYVVQSLFEHISPDARSAAKPPETHTKTYLYFKSLVI